MRVIAVEEHYWDRELAATFTGADAIKGAPQMVARLFEYGEQRLREMDAAGIDMQVLSHGAPGTQQLVGEQAITIARGANDRLHAIVAAHPDRFAAFACLPTAEPLAAADELERAVSTLGFVGAMIHGLTGRSFIDERRFWPIFERAQALDVPIYIHPSFPHPALVDAYLKEYAAEFPALVSAGWGFTVEAATQAIRLALSGVFDAYPSTQIILGHLGESLPFLLWRINQALSRPGNRGSFSFADVFRRHFWVTTSGNFSDTALRCTIAELGIDRILFAVDYPFVANEPAIAWLRGLDLAQADRAQIAEQNATALLKLKI